MRNAAKSEIDGRHGGTLPRRERERLSRRVEIIDAACEVFAEKGFERATLDEIAERAEYGKGTLYNYFKNKDDLFAAAMQHVFDVFYEIAVAACAQNQTVRECFADYTKRSVAFYRDHYALCQMMTMECLRRGQEEGPEACLRQKEQADTITAPLVARLRKGMKESEIKRGDPRLLTTLFVGLVDHYYLQLSREQLPASDRELNRQVNALITVFFDGVAAHQAAPKGK